MAEEAGKIVPMERKVIAPKVDFSEIGYTGLERTGGYIYEEFIPELRWPQAIRIYKQMMYNDAIIGAILFVIEQLTRGTTWRVEAASNKNADKKAAEFIEQCMNDMSVSWFDTITEILTMYPFGFSWHEIIYKRRLGQQRTMGESSKYSDGKIGWRKLPGRAAETIVGWEYEKDGDGLLGVWQQGPPTYEKVLIPIEKSLHFRTTTARNNPEGRSILRTAYRAWYFKTRIEEIEGIGIERDLAGLPVLTPPEGLDVWNDQDPEMRALRLKGEKLVRNIRRDQNEGVFKPFGWELELLSTGGRRQFDTSAIINRWDQRIAVTMVADLIMLGADKVGSFALAEVKKEMLGWALEAMLLSIAEVFNRHAIPRLMRINGFQLEEYPKLVPGQVTVPPLAEIGKLIAALSGAGADLFEHPEEWEDLLSRALGLRIKLVKKEEQPPIMPGARALPPGQTPGKALGEKPEKPEKPGADQRALNGREANKDKV